MSVTSDNTVALDSLRIDVLTAARELEDAVDALRRFANQVANVDPSQVTEGDAACLPRNVHGQFATMNHSLRRAQDAALTAVLRAGQVKAVRKS